MIDSTKFKQFEIEILEKTEEVQIELAQVGTRRMLIATDLDPIRDKTYRQEAYGPADFSDQEMPEIIEDLKKRLQQ